MSCCLQASDGSVGDWVLRRYRGVSRKKGRWEAKVMVDRRWAFRDLYDSETEAAQAYDDALWRLKPEFASSYANFKDGEVVEFPSPSSGISLGQKTRCQPKCECAAVADAVHLCFSCCGMSQSIQDWACSLLLHDRQQCSGVVGGQRHTSACTPGDAAGQQPVDCMLQTLDVGVTQAHSRIQQPVQPEGQWQVWHGR